MSTLAVAKIESVDATTDLIISSANTNTGNVRVFASNNTILFSGNPVFTGTLPGIEPAFSQANTARTHANSAFAQANTARDSANNAASTGKAIAMAIVFG